MVKEDSSKQYSNEDIIDRALENHKNSADVGNKISMDYLHQYQKGLFLKVL